MAIDLLLLWLLVRRFKTPGARAAAIAAWMVFSFALGTGFITASP
jgi:uncharacterized membrane protein (GlpM family)